MLRIDLLRRLFSRRLINSNTGCWEWTGAKSDGYGTLSINKRLLRVHRISAFLFLNFNLNNDLCICHHCDNPSCFNPAHLFIGTQKSNQRDAWEKGHHDNIVFRRLHAPKGAIWCPSCRGYLPFGDFHRNKNRLSGYHSDCKRCRHAKYEEYKQSEIA